MLSVCYLAMKIIYHAPSLRIDLIFFKDLKRRGRRDDGLLFIKRQLPSHCDGMGEG